MEFEQLFKSMNDLLSNLEVAEENKEALIVLQGTVEDLKNRTLNMQKVQEETRQQRLSWMNNVIKSANKEAEKSLNVEAMRTLIDDINAFVLPEGVRQFNRDRYTYLYYIKQLVSHTDNKPLKDFVEMEMQNELKHQTNDTRH